MDLSCLDKEKLQRYVFLNLPIEYNFSGNVSGSIPSRSNMPVTLLPPTSQSLGLICLEVQKLLIACFYMMIF